MGTLILFFIRFQILSMIKLRIRSDRPNKTEIKMHLKLIVPETRVILLHCHMYALTSVFFYPKLESKLKFKLY